MRKEWASALLQCATAAGHVATVEMVQLTPRGHSDMEKSHQCSMNRETTQPAPSAYRLLGQACQRGPARDQKAARQCSQRQNVPESRSNPSRPPAHLAWEAAAHNACVQVSAIQHLHRLIAALDHLPEGSLHIIWHDLHRATLISWHDLSSTHSAGAELTSCCHAVHSRCTSLFINPNLTDQTSARATQMLLF